MNTDWRGRVNSLHKVLGRSRNATRLALLIRNQCQCVIGYSLGECHKIDGNSEQWLIEQVAPRSSTFIDVGANIGEWAATFLAHMPGRERALLFEPADYAMQELKRRFEKMPDISLVQSAVSDVAGESTFYEEPEGGATSSLLSGYSKSDATKRVVPVTTLDEEARKQQLDRIDCLKIDTEGYDLHVLRGAVKLLSNHRIGIIQFEYGNAWPLAGSTLYAAYNFLGTFGYQMFLLKSNSLLKLDYDRYGEYFRYSNYVAVAPGWYKWAQQFIVETV